MDSQEGGARKQTYTDGYDTYCAISEHLWDLELFKSKHLVQPGTCRLSSADMKVRKRDRERGIRIWGEGEREGERKKLRWRISCLYTLVIMRHAMWGICFTHHGVNLLRSLPSSSASLFLRPRGSHRKGTSRHWADKPSKNKRSGSVSCQKLEIEQGQCCHRRWFSIFTQGCRGGKGRWMLWREESW